MDQRFATYIVISKPKRKSIAVGVFHCMVLISCGLVRRPAGAVGTVHPAPNIDACAALPPAGEA